MCNRPDSSTDLLPPYDRSGSGAGAQGSAHFETDPQVCSAAVAEREAALRAARLTYTGEQVGAVWGLWALVYPLRARRGHASLLWGPCAAVHRQASCSQRAVYQPVAPARIAPLQVMVELVQSAEEAVAAGEPGGGAGLCNPASVWRCLGLSQGRTSRAHRHSAPTLFCTHCAGFATAYHCCPASTPAQQLLLCLLRFAAERKSKRARKGRAPVTVDSNHTLQVGLARPRGLASWMVPS